ncbi:MAG: hypothetical protein ACYTG1_01040 [Planctomycetota bacterium]
MRKAGRDAVCVGCGYALRGLPVAGCCPECGAPVDESLRARGYLAVKRGLRRALRHELAWGSASLAVLVGLLWLAAPHLNGLPRLGARGAPMLFVAVVPVVPLTWLLWSRMVAVAGFRSRVLVVLAIGAITVVMVTAAVVLGTVGRLDDEVAVTLAYGTPITSGVVILYQHLSD